jgi:hypothetical protein
MNEEGCVISGFCRCVNEIFALLGCYAAYIGSELPTFRDYLSNSLGLLDRLIWDR